MNGRLSLKYRLGNMLTESDMKRQHSKCISERKGIERGLVKKQHTLNICDKLNRNQGRCIYKGRLLG